MRRCSIVIVLMLAALPAGAFHDPGLPEIASASLGSGSWVRYELLAADDSTLDVEVVMELHQVNAAWAADWILLEDGSGGSGLTSISSGSGTRVVTPAAGVLVEDDPTPLPGGGFGSATTYFGLPAGAITVIVGTVADGGSIDAGVVISGEGITLLDQSAGEGTFAFDDEDFEPQAHVRAPAGLVEVAAVGSVEVTTEDELYAWFVTHHDIAQTRYSGPARSETSTTFNGFGWIILNGEPAGEHVFSLDHAVGALFTGWALVGVPAGT